MTIFEEIATEVAATADKLAVLCDQYLSVGAAVARETGRGGTDGGLSGAQLRRRLQTEILARLSPKPIGMVKPALTLSGAPEARRYILVNGPMPGLK
ncbi:MAG TPA: hypothetical protein VHY36_11150 [Steroidobacteraceae bacterium]|jgi:hypothetical protein|nr:hypothetical protein [Steroidobacteraceae bacterium]